MNNNDKIPVRYYICIKNDYDFILKWYNRPLILTLGIVSKMIPMTLAPSIVSNKVRFEVLLGMQKTEGGRKY